MGRGEIVTGLAGAIVCVVTRGTQFVSLQDATERALWVKTWATQFDAMTIAYQRLTDDGIDVQAVIMQVPNTDDVGNFQYGSRTFASLFPPGVSTGIPSWIQPLRITDTQPNEHTQLLPLVDPVNSEDTPQVGRMPTTQAYVDLFDDRQIATDTSFAFLSKFGQPPSDWLISADLNVRNRFITRRFGTRESGLIALGMSNETAKHIKIQSIDGRAGQYLVHNNMLIKAIRAVRKHFGTATEVSEYSQFGYDVSDGPQPEAVLQFDTMWGAMARQLERVAVLSGVTP